MPTPTPFLWFGNQAREAMEYYWDALSHVPSSEQCGWCKDRFGVSWQVVPADMGRLQTNDAQVKAMMGMKKIDIAELESLAD